MRYLYGCFFCVALWNITATANDAVAADDGTEQRPRVLWKTSRVVGSPEPPLPYRVERRFLGVSIKQPLGVYPEPGTNRLFVIQHLNHWAGPGRILAIEDDETAADIDLLLYKDFIIYGLAFHRGYEENRHVFLGMNGPVSVREKKTRISRFTVSRERPRVIEPQSEVVILDWDSDGHNGGDVGFSPKDGFLYFTAGDRTADADQDRTGQDLSKIPGSVVRVDVDHPADGKAYSVPADNPFLETPGARPEIWAYGLRNPWRMSFDEKTGHLWVGNNGQDLWEQIYLIRRGGNYGWSAMEGAYPYYPDRQRGPSPLSGPVVDHPHYEALSLTGGRVYYGSKLPELHGAYLYGDWGTGKIWAVRHDGEKILWHKELADTTLSIGGFGVDHDGEIFVVDQAQGGLYRLVPTPAEEPRQAFPRTLSETGLFTSVETHTVDEGLIPYGVKVPRWSGGARAERYVALPFDSKMGYTERSGWQFPEGAVVIKTLSAQMDVAKPDSWRRVETQMLTKQEGEWAAYSYAWNDDGTDAALVESAGMRRSLEIRDPEAPGGKRVEPWRFLARAECTACHTRAVVIGLSTVQLNRPAIGDRATNQIELWRQLGVFQAASEPIPPATELSSLVDPHGVNTQDASHDLETRARAYLHANCAHCHVWSGGGNAQIVLSVDTPREKTLLFDVRALQGDFGLVDGKIVAPGDPHRSVLYYRLSTLGGGRMPRLGVEKVDRESLALVRDWIASLPAVPPASTEGRETERKIMATRDREKSAIARLQAGPGLDTQQTDIDDLLQSTSGALELLEQVESKRLAGSTLEAVLKSATTHERPETRDLFERFVPPDQRIQRLGSRVDPQSILAIRGDATRGHELFRGGTVAQCKSCHRFSEGPEKMGPDLLRTGTKLSRDQILESILDPSKKIEPKYTAYVAILTTGETHTGVLIRRGAEMVVLKNGKNEEVRLPSGDVIELAPQKISLMPEGLAGPMTAQQLADLLAFLEAAK